MPTYTIQEGDHVSGLAEQFGFRELETIWDHPDNADLKALRKDPHILFPGDLIFIPDKAEKIASVPTTKVHFFEVKVQPLKLNLVLQDVRGQPRANLKCKLDLDGTVSAETTGGDGAIAKVVPRTAKVGKLTLPDIEIPFLIGHLDPIDKQSGQIARLDNLGYEAGDVDAPDAERFCSAIEEFQCDNSLPVNGVCDSATQAKLKEVHGC